MGSVVEIAQIGNQPEGNFLGQLEFDFRKIKLEKETPSSADAVPHGSQIVDPGVYPKPGFPPDVEGRIGAVSRFYRKVKIPEGLGQLLDFLGFTRRDAPEIMAGPHGHYRRFKVIQGGIRKHEESFHPAAVVIFHQHIAGEKPDKTSQRSAPLLGSNGT